MEPNQNSTGRKTTLERLMAKVEICPESGCWLWTASVDRYGYPKIRVGADIMKGHRVSFMLHIGAIPLYKSAHTGEAVSKMVIHSCDNTRCVNPRHIQPGTFHQNMFDRDNRTSSERTQPNDHIMNLNEFTVAGNLTRDPDVRHTPKGTPVAEISIATNRRVKDKVTDQWKDEPTFLDIVLWGRDAENAGQYLKKGRGVHVKGRLQIDKWQDAKSGEMRQKVRLIGESIQYLANAESLASSARARETKTQRLEREAKEQAAAGGRHPNQGGAAPPQSSMSGEDDFDDVPF